MEVSERYIERSRVLVANGRYREAIAELREALIHEPRHIEGLALLCICYLNTDQDEACMTSADILIGTAPGMPTGYYLKGNAALRLKKYKEATTLALQAISLDPNDADHWALLSGISIAQNNWTEGLQYADKGLACDPEDTLCLNHRTLCLTKLNRLEELQNNINDTLAGDPHNWYTQSNVGWSKLETGDHDTARRYFAESLRINPNNENARNGMIAAIKARNFLFRWFLQYSFWLNRQGSNMQWAIMIGFVFGRRVLLSMAATFPILYVVVGILILMVYLSWMISPITDLFLLMDPFGRQVLRRDEKISATSAGIGISGAALSAAAAWYTGIDWLWQLAIYLGLVAIPVSKYFDLHPKRRPVWLALYTVGMVVVGAASVVMTFINMPNADAVGGAFLFGLVAYTWIIVAVNKS